tara:strand:- start:76 stop:276 length:201 start_codon:yes stop_codon:yes gene_type:complete
MIYPKHVAIIMDGNGRWGIKKKNSRNYGHKKGLVSVEKVIDAAIEKKNQISNFICFFYRKLETTNW